MELLKGQKWLPPLHDPLSPILWILVKRLKLDTPFLILTAIEGRNYLYFTDEEIEAYRDDFLYCIPLLQAYTITWMSPTLIERMNLQASAAVLLTGGPWTQASRALLAFHFLSVFCFITAPTLSGCTLRSPNTCSPLTSDATFGSSGWTLCTVSLTLSFVWVSWFLFSLLFLLVLSASGDLRSASLHQPHPLSPQSWPPFKALILCLSQGPASAGLLRQWGLLKYYSLPFALLLPSPGLVKTGCLTSRTPRDFFFSKNYIPLQLLTQ